ncbi:MAG: hypothetical protein RLY86_1493 [Pseudomonadota bacterium]
MLAKFVAHHLYDPEARARDPAHGMPAAVEADLRARGLLRSAGRPALATVRRRLASLARLHRLLGLPSPTEDPGFRAVLAPVARTARGPRRRKSALAIDLALLRRLLAACPPTPAGERDRALLWTAWASGGRRRSELAALTVEQLERVPDGWRLRLGRTKTSEADDDTTVPLLGEGAQALSRWLALAGICRGGVFRGVDRWGGIADRPLSPKAVNDIVKAAAARAGIDPARVSAHGLRAGFYTEAQRCGIPLPDAMRMTRARDIRTAAAYYTPGEALANPAARMAEGPGEGS